jgi:hypothetical protein
VIHDLVVAAALLGRAVAGALERFLSWQGVVRVVMYARVVTPGAVVLQDARVGQQKLRRI